MADPLFAQDRQQLMEHKFVPCAKFASVMFDYATLWTEAL